MRVYQYALDQLNKFKDSFSQSEVHFRNAIFNSLLSLNEIISYDLYPLVRKFSPAYHEQNPHESPYIHPIKIDMVIEELKYIDDIISSLNIENSLGIPLNIFLRFKGVGVIEDTRVRKFQNLLELIRNQKYITYVVQLGEENPFYKPLTNIIQIDGMKQYIQIITMRIKECFDKVQVKKKNEKFFSLLDNLFGKTSISTIEHYNDEYNKKLIQYELDSFVYTEILEYVKYFYQSDKQKKVLSTIEAISIQAVFTEQWKGNKFIDAYSKFKEVVRSILNLEQNLSDYDNLGKRIKNLIDDLDKQKLLQENKNNTEKPSSFFILNDYIKDINNQVKEILKIEEYASRIMVIILLDIINDIKKKDKKTIRNVSSIIVPEEGDITNLIINSYNMLRYLNQLIRLFIDPDTGEKISM